MNTVLYAENEPDDIFLMLRACKQAGMTPPRTVPNGREAIAYLKGEGKYADRNTYPMPQLILIDIRMPEVDGFEVVKWIRSDDSLASLPALILTSSSQDHDVKTASSLGANGYLVKPGRIDELVRMTQALKDYWLRHDRFVAHQARRAS